MTRDPSLKLGLFIITAALAAAVGRSAHVMEWADTSRVGWAVFWFLLIAGSPWWVAELFGGGSAPSTPRDGRPVGPVRPFPPDHPLNPKNFTPKEPSV